jgi:hypothetical protein
MIPDLSWARAGTHGAAPEAVTDEPLDDRFEREVIARFGLVQEIDGHRAAPADLSSIH